VLILVGTVLLALPISSEGGERTSVVDSSFTAISAVTTTGLAVVDTADHWSKTGESVILGLIQLGGLGVMISATFLMVMVGFRIGMRGRALATEDLGSPGLANVRRFVLFVVAFTLLLEAAGFGLMYLFFGRHGYSEQALWRSAFHSVSAFNNAGLDLSGGSQGFAIYGDAHYLLLVTAALVLAGGISFPVLANLLSFRRFKLLSLTTKLVLLGSGTLVLVGTAFVLGMEHANPGTLGPMPWGEKLTSAFFQSATARTAGFSTTSVAALEDATLFLLVILMFIGAASGSTGGGIKVNTAAVIGSAVASSVVGRQANEVFGRRIPDDQLRMALALAFLALALVAVAAMVLVAAEDLSFIHGLFLVVSGFATVGLSPIDVADLSLAGKVLLMTLMFTGKIGTPLLGLLLVRLGRQQLYDYPEERVNLG
jgi:trk system potassium uptake protein TrkH